MFGMDTMSGAVKPLADVPEFAELMTMFSNPILGLLAGAIIMEILARLGYIIKKERAFGEADTYVAGALGACFGLQGLLQVLIYTLFASMIGAVT